MTDDIRPPAVRRSPGRSRPALRWAVLAGLSAALAAALEAVRLPAAVLLGPMLAAMAMAAAEAGVRLPAAPFIAAQGLIGCLIARSIPLAVLDEVARDWPAHLTGVGLVIGTSGLLGWLLARWRVLPGASAVWGAMPGGAAAMTLLAEAHGEDVRLVAVMQHLRLVCVAAAASLVTGAWAAAAGSGGAEPAWFPAVAWFSAVAWGPLAQTLALAGIGAVAGQRLGLPAGAMLLPLAAGIALQGAGWMRIELPPWLLALAYAVVGWNVGLRFTGPILRHTARALPRVAVSILLLMAVCGLCAAVLVVALGIDPLTAYLATSPGGADSMAIVAASSAADVPFVMTMQTTRFVLVLVLGPLLARFLARRLGAT